MPKPKVFVGVPIYGGVQAFFMQSLMRLQADAPCSLEIAPLVGDSLVSRARNSLTKRFLESDCTHLLFIDSDLIFSGEHIERLLSHQKPVVAGFYPKKKEGSLEWVCNRSLAPSEIDANGLQEVRYMGTGFMMVEREAILRMIAAYPDTAYTNDDTNKTEWDLWPVGVHSESEGIAINIKLGKYRLNWRWTWKKKLTRYLSEDWFFCQRWLDMGGRVYGDTKVILKHVGQAVYPLQSQQGAITQ
jgi:hypothetical protein